MSEAANKAWKSSEGWSRLVSKESVTKAVLNESLTRVKTASSKRMGSYNERLKALRR